MIPKITGLLFIDCWEYPNQRWYDNLRNDIALFTDVSSIIVANYNIPINTTNDPILCRTLELYGNKHRRADILASIVSNSIWPAINTPPIRSTSKFIHDLYDNDPRAFSLYEVPSMMAHLSLTSPDAKDWLVIGSQWQNCIHYRPLGLHNLRLIPDCTFYVTSWSVNCGQANKRLTPPSTSKMLTEELISQDSLKWEK